MSKLDELIREVCPDGVEYKTVGEIAEVGTGSSNGNEAVDDGEYPFFIRSQTVKFKNDYEYDEEAIIIPGEGGVGDIFHYVNGKYSIHQRVYRIHFVSDLVDTKFVYYYMGTYFKSFIMRKAVNATVLSIRKPMIQQFRIPVPPLPVQREIVRILDNFAELTAELTARKKQYEFYRDKLLAVKSVGSDVVLLGDIASIHTGSKPDKILDTISEYEYINAGTSNSGYAEQPNCDEDTVTTPSRGQGGIGYIGYQSKPFYLGPLCYAIRSKSQEFMINKYIYHWLISHSSDILTLKNEGGTPALNKTDLAKIKIVAPPLSIQQRIVNVLDNFDAICSDLNIGLPAEIEARQKQYEYYRDKLLSFKELKP